MHEPPHLAGVPLKRKRWLLAGIVLGAAFVLIAVSVIQFLRLQNTGHSPDLLVDSDFRGFESSLAFYKLNEGQYPTTEQGLEALEKRPEPGPEPRRWSQIMTRLPKDPWGNSYRYQFPAPGDPEKPLISSNGPDGLAGTADDLSSTGE